MMISAEENEKLKKIEKILQSHPLVIPKYLRNPDVQTIFSRYIPYFKREDVPIERRHIALPDGSQLAADLSLQPDYGTHPTVVLVTGFEGYIIKEVSLFGTSTRARLYDLGYNVIHVRQRAEGDTIHLTKSIGYVGDDFPIALQQIIDWGFTKLSLIGYSAGGYSILYTLGKLQENTKKHVIGAVAISSPLNIIQPLKRAEQRRFYDWFLLRSYRHLIKRRMEIDPPGTWDVQEFEAIKDKWQWAETYLDRWGYDGDFKTLEELNERIDVTPLLPDICIPTLIIHAADDPVSPIEPFKTDAVKNNPYMLTLLTKYGGHCGFVTTKKDYGDVDGHWAQNRAVEFVNLLQ